MTSTTSPLRLLSSIQHGDSLSYLSPSSGSDNSFATAPMSPTPSTPRGESTSSVAATAASPPSGASVAGIVTTPRGERLIPATARNDGSVRKEIRIRPGFVPTEDVARYNVAERVQLRRQRLAREKALGEQWPVTAEVGDVEKDVDDASKILEGLVIDERGPALAAKPGSDEWDSIKRVGLPAVASATAKPTERPRIAPTRQPKNAPSDRSGGWSRSNSVDSTASQESKDNSHKAATDSYSATTTPRAAPVSKTAKTVARGQATATFSALPVKDESAVTVQTTCATKFTAATGWDSPTLPATANASGWDMPNSSAMSAWGGVASQSDWTPLESATSIPTDSAATKTASTQRSGKPDRAEGQDRGRSGWKNDNDGDSHDSFRRTGRGDNTPDSRPRLPDRRRSGRDGDYSSPAPSSHLPSTDSNGTPDNGPRRVNPDRRGRSPEERKRAFEEFLNRPLETKHNYPSFTQFVGARGGGTSTRVGAWMSSSENNKDTTDREKISGVSRRASSSGKVLESRYAH
ncbi:hypothetical protein V1527DRAFT_469533 [Lipomyces starkeyi]